MNQHSAQSSFSYENTFKILHTKSHAQYCNRLLSQPSAPQHYFNVKRKIGSTMPQRTLTTRKAVDVNLILQTSLLSNQRQLKSMELLSGYSQQVSAQHPKCFNQRMIQNINISLDIESLGQRDLCIRRPILFRFTCFNSTAIIYQIPNRNKFKYPQEITVIAS